LIYGCRRSTTVFSENYATLARLSLPKFREVCQKYPKLEAEMKDNIMKKYNDPFRKFMMDSLMKVPYYSAFSDDDKNFFAFNFEQQNFKQGSVI